MTTLYPVVGSKIFIGGRVMPKGTVTAADFSGAVWTEIKGWTNAGTIGDTQNTLDQSLISERRIRKVKTTLDGGTMENQFIPMALDSGQIAFKDAIADCNPFQFKIEWGADCAPESVVTISVASPGVITWNDHGLLAGQPVVFSTTGALPTGLTAGTVYYVLSAGLTQNAFSVANAPGGTAIDTSSTQSGVHTAVAPPVGYTDLFYGLAMPGVRQGGEATAAHLRAWSIAIDSNIVEI